MKYCVTKVTTETIIVEAESKEEAYNLVNAEDNDLLDWEWQDEQFDIELG